MVPDKPTTRFEALDSLRGVCAMMVVLYHMHQVGGAIVNVPFVRHSWVFVDFFFVLSGFVIASSYMKRLGEGFGVARFMGLRLGRIYPLHLFVLLLLCFHEVASILIGDSLIGGRTAFDTPNSPANFVRNLLLLQSSGLRESAGWNPVSWSVAAEIWAYLLFALVVVWLKRGATAFFAGLALLSLAVFVAFHRQSLDTTYDFGIIRCFYGFSIGMLVQRLRERWQPRGGHLAEIGTTVLVIAYVAMFADGVTSLIAPLVFALPICLFASENGCVSWLLNRKPFRVLGTLSYAIYMFHLFALVCYYDLVDTFHQWVSWQIAPDIATIGALFFVTVMSWPVWHFIEMPARDWSRQRVSQSRTREMAGLPAMLVPGGAGD